MHTPVPGADISKCLGVSDDTEPVAFSKYCVDLRDENGEAAVYQGNKAPLWQVELTHRAADENG